MLRVMSNDVSIGVASADVIFAWALHLGVAIVLALPTAWDRERHTRSAGLRTFPIVAMGACAFVLTAHQFIGPDAPDAMARIMQGLMTGIGFVGGGAILKDDDRVTGLASAASIWIMGALGAAVGFGLWMLAVLISAFNFVLMFALSRIKQEVPTERPSENGD